MKRLLHFASVTFGGFLLAVGLLGTTHVAHAAALTSTNVEPASLVAGATGSVTVTFTTASSIPVDGKIFVGFGSGFDITAVTGATCSTMDGTFTTGLWGGVGPVSITRMGDGTIQTPGVETCTFTGIKNPTVSGSTGVYAIEMTDFSESDIDTDFAVAADTITPGELGGTNVQPANLVAGSAPTVNVDFITANPIPANGKIKITFGANFNVSGATSAQCSGTMDGTFATSVVGQTVTITRQGDGTSEPAGTQGCAMGGIVNPPFSGSTGTYAISTTTSADVLIDQRSVVPADTMTVGALSSTNVQPASLVAGANSMTTFTFTTANPIPNNGVIKVTFGANFNVASANSGTCSSQDGTFVTTVSDQTVIVTRQADGTSEPAGAQTCTIGNIVNPAFSGSTGTYTIATFLTGGITGIDTDAAVASDTISHASSSGSPSVALTYDIRITAPVVSATFAPGNSISIAWSTAASTGSVAAVNLAYSTDGSLYTTIVTGTSDDGTYDWTAPNITSQNVTIRAQATDLLNVLDTVTSGIFTISSSVDGVPDTALETPEPVSTMLSEGDYMRGVSWSTVYYVDASGNRKPFLDAQTFFTYAESFDDVILVTDDSLANYPIGTPMLAKAGTVLVKIQSMNQVYAVTDVNGVQTLRWITSETIAQSLLGAYWADYVIDIPPTAWPHFTVGEPIDSATDITVDVANMRTRAELASM